jgi:hypothetical protein
LHHIRAIFPDGKSFLKLQARQDTSKEKGNMVFLVLIFLSFIVCCSVGANTCISGRFKVESPFGAPMQSMRLTDGLNSATTDNNGVAILTCMKEGKFVVKGVPEDQSKYQDLYIIGSALSSFNYTTYYGSRDEAKAVEKILNIKFDPTAGIVVVGLDVSSDGSNQPESLQPAVGASAELEYASATQQPTPFVYKGLLPKFGAEILEGGQSFITYPNVPTNTTVSERASPQCLLSPGLPQPQEELIFEALPDSITVVSYICSDVKQ